MKVKLRFPLKDPFIVDDHWPLSGQEAVLTFETVGREVRALIVTFKNQPIIMAPRVLAIPQGPVKAHVEVTGELEVLGRRIVQRFIDYVQLHFFVDVDVSAMDAEYIPEDEQERAALDLYSLRSVRQRPVSYLPFSMLSQAFFASESGEDPSFAARMFSLGRECLIEERYIEAFRYFFLLFEALYGDGQFKGHEIAHALAHHAKFRSFLEDTIATLRADPRSPGHALACAYQTPEALAKYLVDRRGFYFHGNLARRDAWHPQKQREAEPLVDVCLKLASRVAHSVASAMFVPEMETKVRANAETNGAIMTIHVRFQFIDRHGLRRDRSINISAPGTVVTNSLAIRVHKGFLEWAEINLSDATLLSAVAYDGAGAEIFKCRYSQPIVSEEQKLVPET